MATRRLTAGLRSVAPRLIHTAARFTRPLTMGVRAIILEGQGDETAVFLVRHSYVAGWHLPGGAVETGESCRAAILREVEEECGIAIRGTPELVGIHFNRKASRRDHVATYLVRDFAILRRREPDWEIVEAGFFRLGELPAGTTTAVKARLAEALGGAPVAEDW